MARELFHLPQSRRAAAGLRLDGRRPDGLHLCSRNMLLPGWIQLLSILRAARSGNAAVNKDGGLPENWVVNGATMVERLANAIFNQVGDGGGDFRLQSQSPYACRRDFYRERWNRVRGEYRSTGSRRRINRGLPAPFKSFPTAATARIFVRRLTPANGVPALRWNRDGRYAIHAYSSRYRFESAAVASDRRTTRGHGL